MTFGLKKLLCFSFYIILCSFRNLRVNSDWMPSWSSASQWRSATGIGCVKSVIMILYILSNMSPTLACFRVLRTCPHIISTCSRGTGTCHILSCASAQNPVYLSGRLRTHCTCERGMCFVFINIADILLSFNYIYFFYVAINITKKSEYLICGKTW